MTRPTLRQRPPRTLVLVGLMGAGKTSIGRRLASRLGLPFVDADQEIERAAGCSIPEFFDRYGEPAFREGERRVIARLLDQPLQVLSTGGGAFMDAETRALVRQRAHSIWLRAELDLLVLRTARRGGRPLLKDGDPKETLRQLMELRHPYYAQADITVDSGDRPAEETVDRVIESLQDYLDNQPPARASAADEPAMETRPQPAAVES
ncbi:shikimate kinase [Nitrospirillum iridis]|uniref:Shikimate kinase n=1 Tax=Nitrospirillum iridis TaxID=765888 RepID=A0A7X0AYM0_9PROT|nr:shikimate kinase [Nitrospirillum iridis]MBB6252529.1 shikimate kinase [Nitrospirillum iridis]